MDSFFCNACGMSKYRSFPNAITKPMSVVACQNCGLIATYPGLSSFEIEDFYLTSFDGDPGSNKTDLGELEQTEVDSGDHELQKHTIPIIEQWINPNGKDWLELRFRSGEFLTYLKKNGANVFGADLFQKNIDRAAPLVEPGHLFKTTVHNVLEDFNIPLDVVSGVSIHVLSHLPDPTRALKKIWGLLKIGGLLIIEEKDVTKISKGAKTLPLSHPNPIAHYHHFTLQTCRNLIALNGFEVLFAKYIDRISDLHHFLIIAQKTSEAIVLNDVSIDEINHDFDTLVMMHTGQVKF